METVSKVS